MSTRQLSPSTRRRFFPVLGWSGLFFWLTMALPLQADEFDTLRLYWLNQLTGTNISAGTLTSRAITASNYWTSLNTNVARTSLWSDLPLGSVSANVTSHFSRLQSMALAWASPGCSLQGNTNLAAAITNSLDWLGANSYTPTATEYDNWWDWEIGGLQAFNNAAVLIYPTLTATQLTNYNNSVDHFSAPTKAWMTGANLADQCKGIILRGILGKNAAKIALAQTNLSPVFLYVTSGDGFYRDGSFVQHTRIAYTGTYGVVLIGDIAQLGNLLNGSTWQITDPNLTNVFNWVFDAYQPVIYKGAVMDMVRGRAISRYNEQEQNDGSGAISAIRQLAQFAPAPIAAAFTNWANSPSLPPGQYHFAGMDRMVAWRTNFCFGLSMCSTRIANYESINGENLHGWFTGDGMTYLYLGNSETQFTGDFWPTIDPYHLPGVTAEIVARPNGSRSGTASSQNWVGGAEVADSYGVAGMSLAATNTLTAKKSWFMFDNQIVCLGAGITCGDTAQIGTTVENRRLGITPTNQFTINGTPCPATGGWNSNFTSASWCSLAGVAGYYFPGNATNVQAALETSIHSWSEINDGTYLATTTNLNTNSYLKLWFNHAGKPTNATYAYVVLPNFTASNMVNYAAAPEITVITNTATVQAASKPALGLVAANFWTDGTNAASLLKVNKKASVITSETLSGISVGVADPTQTNTASILVTIDRVAAAVTAIDPGVTVVQLAPQIILSVNVNGARGKTLQATFLYPPPSLTWDANTGTTDAQDGSGPWESSHWWTGGSNILWSDATSYIAVFGAGGTGGTVTAANPHSAFGMTFNPVSSGSYALTGNGQLTLSNGITADASATVGLPLKLPANQTWTVATNQTLAISGIIAAPAPINLTLSGAGSTSLIGPTNQLSTNVAAIVFADTSNRSTLVIGTNAQSLSALDLNDGVTATITGGALSVGGASDLLIGGTTTGAQQTLDVSGLKEFNANLPGKNFSVGGQANTVAGFGTVSLAATNTITANVLGVQNVTGSTTTQSTGNLLLGQKNTFNVNSVLVGLTRDYGTIRFASGLTNPSLTLRASDGVSRANVTVGTRGSSFFATTTALIDLGTNMSGTSTLDALVGTLQLANENFCASGADVLNGIFVMSGGLLDATNIVIGLKSSVTTNSLGIVNGTFTQQGGTVKVATLTLGDRVNGNTNALNATYNLNGGILNAQNISPGANAATRTLYWTNGVLANFDPSTDLTVAAGINLLLTPGGNQSISIGAGRIGNVSSVIGQTGPGATLNKTGPGTLALGATNTFTGPLGVNDGLLLVNGALGTNIINVQAGATLGGTGTINGTANLLAGGTIQNTSSSLTINTLNLGNVSTAVTSTRFKVASGGKILTATLTVNGTNYFYLTDTNLPVGTNILLTFVGGMGGSSGFGGLKIGSAPTNVTVRLQNSGTAVQLVVTALVPPRFNGDAQLSGGKLAFNFSGPLGQTYRVLGSTNLFQPIDQWPTLGSGIFGASAASFSESSLTNTQNFYRIVSP